MSQINSTYSILCEGTNKTRNHFEGMRLIYASSPDPGGEFGGFEPGSVSLRCVPQPV